MRLFKSLLVAILSSAGLLVVLTACSGSAQPETSPSAVVEPPQTEVEVAPAPPPPEPEPAPEPNPKPVVKPVAAKKAPAPAPAAAPIPVPAADLSGALNEFLDTLAPAGTNTTAGTDTLGGILSGFMSDLNIQANPDGTMQINGNKVDPAAALQEFAQGGAPGKNASAFLDGLLQPEQIEALVKTAEKFQPTEGQLDLLDRMTESFQGLQASSDNTRETAGASVAPLKKNTEPGKVLKRSYPFKEAGNRNQEYGIYIPKSYEAETPAPLFVLLHGLGSSPQQVLRYQSLTAEAEKRGIILAAPFGYNRKGWYGSRGPGNTLGFELPDNLSEQMDLPANLGELSEKDVLNVVDLMSAEFNVDPKRVYLGGHSMGGGGTLYLGMKYPDKWAGLAPLAPAIYSSPEALSKIPKMPVIMVQGELDKLVPVKTTRRWAEAMKELDMPHEYIEIKGGDHVNSIARNPKVLKRVFDFLEGHSRP